eukprot:TRINITY_DN56756_c0_g1_i1.p1 TRINITY_DN56756_c0_g1~~TRINITY_DN56756_c0_g1_i1.p1  ORF type:complete len:623 (+),score=189.10 TRINITY_DN56756_c0_g1_i1:90-1958(+)
MDPPAVGALPREEPGCVAAACGHACGAADGWLRGSPLRPAHAVPLLLSSATLCLAAAFALADSLVVAADAAAPLSWFGPLWLGGGYLVGVALLGLAAVLRFRRILCAYAICALLACLAMALLLLGGSSIVLNDVRSSYAAAPASETCAVAAAMGCLPGTAGGCPGQAPPPAGAPPCTDALVAALRGAAELPLVIAAAALTVGTAAACAALGSLTTTIAAAAVALIAMTTATAVWIDAAHPSPSQIQAAAIGLSAACNLVSVLLSAVSARCVGRWEHKTTLLSDETRARVTSVLSMVPVFAVCSFLVLLSAAFHPVVSAVRIARDVYSLWILREIAMFWVSIAEVSDALSTEEAIRVRIHVGHCIRGIDYLVLADCALCYANLFLFGGEVIPQWRLYPPWAAEAISLVGGVLVFSLVVALVYNVYEALPALSDAVGERQFVSVKGIIGFVFFVNVSLRLTPLGPHNAVVVSELYGSVALVFVAAAQACVWVCSPLRLKREPPHASFFQYVEGPGRATVLRVVRAGDIELTQGSVVTVDRMEWRGRGQLWAHIDEADGWCPVTHPDGDVLLAKGDPPARQRGAPQYGATQQSEVAIAKRGPQPPGSARRDSAGPRTPSAPPLHG